MIREIKRWEVVCDKCGVSEKVESSVTLGGIPIPSGWKSVVDLTPHPAGGTGYVTRHICPECQGYPVAPDED